MGEAGSGVVWLVGRLASPKKLRVVFEMSHFTVGETNSSWPWSNQQYLVPYLIIVPSFTASLFSSSFKYNCIKTETLRLGSTNRGECWAPSDKSLQSLATRTYRESFSQGQVT